MDKIIHRAKERGQGEYGWLSTRYSFSFANWFEPSRMGFGALRVINDDTVAPASGFPMHSHKDMEIITIVTSGTITHEDNLGNKGEVPEGDVQAMSAGTGVVHAEFNESQTEPLTLFQIWIEPKVRGIEPRWAQKSFGLSNSKSGLTLLAAPDGSPEGLPINQDAYVYWGVLDAERPLKYILQKEGNGVYLFVIDGSVLVEGDTLEAKDAIGLSDFAETSFTAATHATVLIFEVPLE